ncbi:MAG: Ty1/Copia family ribonuclease HI, partial [Marinobacter sp.]
MTSKAKAGIALGDFCHDVGIPDKLVTDLAAELSGPNTEFMKTAKRLHIDVRWAEKGRHWQNHRAEREIGILKQRWRRRVIEKRIPPRLWDYALVYESEILSRMSRGDSLEDRTGYERLTGRTPDISEWLDFEFYDLVWYYSDDAPAQPDEPRRLGRWLGVAHRVGSDLCYWILTDSGRVIASTTVQHVTRGDLDSTEIAERVRTFDKRIDDRLDATGFQAQDMDGVTQYIEDIGLSESDPARQGMVPTDEEYGGMLVSDVTEADEHPDLDQYIGAQLLLDTAGSEPLTARVVRRVHDPSGTPVGRAHKNPMFDTRAYVVEFPDGTLDQYTANVIAENIYSQVDSEGRSYAIMDEITDHRSDNTAVQRSEGYMVSASGNRSPKITTKGWELLVTWKDGTSDWVPLRRLKESNPVEVAEYATANNIDEEPAFRWWVPTVLRRKRRIISKVKAKSKYWRTTHKFGIRLPHSVDEALAIDRETGTDHWARAIQKELLKVRIAWEVRDDLKPEECRSGRQLPGYTEIACHMIFDIKMDFTRKARFVAGGHLTDAPSSITYSSVVSRDSVRIALLVAALNDLDIQACDIGNAYLNAPCRERIWFQGGSEVGPDKGKVLVVTRALYGLKSSGASWRNMFAQSIMDMGFVSTRADPDVYRRRAQKPDGTHYYELLLVYVDDVLAISHRATSIIDEIGRRYEIKEGSRGPPDTYLGAQIYQHFLQDGRSAWGMSCAKYVKAAVRTVEELLREDGNVFRLKTTARVPYPTSYRPELDFSPELGPALHSRFQQLIGILRWAVELGRLDIYLETSILSQYLASPREGHLEAVYHIFAYLRRHPKSSVVFDPRTIDLDEQAFAHTKVSDWSEFYGDVAEELPPDMPEPLGNGIDLTCFVDSDHAGNVVTRRSHTGILIFVNNAPIVWYSKRQNTVETSAFGSEFVALRTARDMLVALRYKLRMFGIPLRGPANVLCDNQGVVKNTSLPA